MSEPKLMFLVAALLPDDVGFFAVSIYNNQEKADDEHEKLRGRLKVLEMKTVTTCVAVPVDMDIIEAFDYQSTGNTK